MHFDILSGENTISFIIFLTYSADCNMATVHWKMKQKPQSYFFLVQVVCFAMNSSPNHKETHLPMISTIVLGLWLAEEGLKSDKHVGPQAKSVMRQTRTFSGS